MTFCPFATLDVELVDLFNAIFALEASIESYKSTTGFLFDGVSGVMRDLSRSVTGLLDALPFNGQFGIILQLLNCCQVNSPHRVKSSFL